MLNWQGGLIIRAPKLLFLSRAAIRIASSALMSIEISRYLSKIVVSLVCIRLLPPSFANILLPMLSYK